MSKNLKDIHFNDVYTKEEVDTKFSSDNTDLDAGDGIIIDDDHSISISVDDVNIKIVDNKLTTAIDLDTKQDTLVSGTNIKTINGTDILGSGNIVVSSAITPEVSVTGFILPSSGGMPIPETKTFDVTSNTITYNNKILYGVVEFSTSGYSGTLLAITLAIDNFGVDLVSDNATLTVDKDGEVTDYATTIIASNDNYGIIVPTEAQALDVNYKMTISADYDGGSSYELPIASADTLGGVKIGENLEITADGVLNAIGGGSGGDSLWSRTFVDNMQGYILMPASDDDIGTASSFTTSMLVAHPTALTSENPSDAENVFIFKPLFTDDMANLYSLNDLLGTSPYNVLSFQIIALYLVYGLISSYTLNTGSTILISSPNGVSSTGIYYVGNAVTLTKDNVVDQSWIAEANLSSAFGMMNVTPKLESNGTDITVDNICTVSDDVVEGWISTDSVSGDIRVLFEFSDFSLALTSNNLVMIEIVDLTNNKITYQKSLLVEASNRANNVFSVEGLESGVDYLIKFKAKINRG